MQTDRKEALRYLGLGKHEPDPETERLLEECIREAERAAEFRHLVREYPLSVEEDGTVDGGCFRVKSANLKKNLSGCDSVLVMAVTVGAEVDRLLARYGKLSVAKAVVMQAAAAAMVEAYCNELNAMWKKEYLEKGLLSARLASLDHTDRGISDAALEIGDSGDRGEPDTGSLCDRGMRGVRKERLRVQKIS